MAFIRVNVLGISRHFSDRIYDVMFDDLMRPMRDHHSAYITQNTLNTEYIHN